MRPLTGLLHYFSFEFLQHVLMLLWVQVNHILGMDLHASKFGFFCTHHKQRGLSLFSPAPGWSNLVSKIKQPFPRLFLEAIKSVSPTGFGIKLFEVMIYCCKSVYICIFLQSYNLWSFHYSTLPWYSLFSSETLFKRVFHSKEIYRCNEFVVYQILEIFVTLFFSLP